MQSIQDPILYQKRLALAAFLHVDPETLRESRGTLYSQRAFFNGTDEAYLVLTDVEATLAAEHAVSEKLWLICLETLFAYFDIEAYPSDVLGKMKTREIRHVNEELKVLVHNTAGMEPLKQKMLSYGNRRNLLADYDQAEHFQNGYFIYRLY